MTSGKFITNALFEYNVNYSFNFNQSGLKHFPACDTENGQSKVK